MLYNDTAGGNVIYTANQWLAEGDPVSGVRRTIHRSCAVAVDLSVVGLCVLITCPHEML